MAMKGNRRLQVYKAYDFASANALVVRCPVPYNVSGAEGGTETSARA
jgi:hypothetical protein